MTGGKVVRMPDYRSSESAWLKAQHERTLEGLADVDGGRVIDHEAVQAWADSLCSDIKSRR
jgi:predicted transcriptional regulator